MSLPTSEAPDDGGCEAALALKLSPVLALLAGLMFFAKAGILSGIFYIQSIVLFVTGLVMCGLPQFQHILFGLVSGGCFFIPGLKYYRQLTESDR